MKLIYILTVLLSLNAVANASEILRTCKFQRFEYLYGGDGEYIPTEYKIVKGVSNVYAKITEVKGGRKIELPSQRVKIYRQDVRDKVSSINKPNQLEEAIFWTQKNEFNLNINMEQIKYAKVYEISDRDYLYECYDSNNKYLGTFAYVGLQAACE